MYSEARSCITLLVDNDKYDKNAVEKQWYYKNQVLEENEHEKNFVQTVQISFLETFKISG